MITTQSTKILNEAKQLLESSKADKGTIREVGFMSFLFFASFFFNNICYLDFNQLHNDYNDYKINNLNDDILNRKGSKAVICAPRDSSKSTTVSLIDVIHDIVYGLEKYIVIFSATEPQVMKRITNLKHQLIDNKLLKRYFRLEGNPYVWSSHRIEVNNICIEGFSSGSEVLGITYQDSRPTKIILDDSEDYKKVDNPDLRNKKEDWFKEVVEELGANYTNTLAIGTMLHQDCLIARLCKRPDFKKFFYKSIIKWSAQQDLWDKWREIYIDLDNVNRESEAAKYYESNKDEMLKDTQVFWEDSENYYTLQEKLVTQGRKAFFKNKQNDPRFRGTHIFDLDKLDYFTIKDNAIHRSDGKIVKIKDLFRYGFLDPSCGRDVRITKNRREPDYAAIAIVGKDGYDNRYLLDCWFDRVSPTKQIEMIFVLHDLWQFHLFGIETNSFQQLLLEPFSRIQAQRRTNKQTYKIPIKKIDHYSNKIARIETLEPFFTNHWLRINRNIKPEFFNLMEQFPTAQYDDPLDATEAAFRLSQVKMIQEPKSEENFLGLA